MLYSFTNLLSSRVGTLEKLTCGYGLVVEHDLAKVETGVRFSLSAQRVKRRNFSSAYERASGYVLISAQRVKRPG